MPTRHLGLKKAADELSLLGGVAALTWGLVSISWSRHGGLGQLLWLCDIALLGTAFGLLLRSRLIVTAQFVGVLAYHLAWHIDFLSYAITGFMPLSATAYMFSGELTPYEKGLSYFQHTFLVPALAWALVRLKPSGFGWLLQALQTAGVFALTYALTAPAENINWVFGAGFAHLSPASTQPIYYYSLMVVILPLLVYYPTNALALWLGAHGRIGHPRSLPPSRRVRIAIALSTTVVITSAVVGRVCDVARPGAASILELPPNGASALERLPTEPNPPRNLSAAYGRLGDEREIPLVALGQPIPRQERVDHGLGDIYLKKISEFMPIDAIPSAPQGIVIRGVRSRLGTVVCGVVASDRFYLQPDCDLNTALDRFELHCQLGREGLSEFVDPASGLPRGARAGSALAGRPAGGLYALTVVSFNGQTAVARSPFYLFKRTGIYTLDDVPSRQ
jgi:hypothetical protein